MDALVCFCACPDAEVAAGIGRTLVGERLAACANVLPGMRSVYRWRGEVEEGDEALLLIKTTRTALPALQARLVALHPYELPELVAVEVAGGLPAYLGWIADNVAGAPPACDPGEQA
jgi:periplasmic divalent cation tolerance protein